MAEPLESAITRKILLALKARGAWAVKIHGGNMQNAGLPDIVGGYRGRLIGLEVKRPGNKPTKLQEYTLQQIREIGGGAAGVVYSVDEALAVLDSLDEES